MEKSDFENLPIEIKDKIFEYLGPTDIINLTLVSKTLNGSVGQCRKCMERFWVKFYSFNLKDMISLQNTVRNYVKLKINRVSNQDHLDYLINLNQPWKKVLIYNCEFKFAERYVKLIRSIAENIEELEVTDIEILSYETYISDQIRFPSLKRVMFRNMRSKAMGVFLGCCENLEVAAFDIGHEVQSFKPLKEFFYEFLRKCHKIKHLQLGPNYMRALFDEENKNQIYDFKLSHLLLKFPIANDLPETSFPQIAEFLRQQPKIEWIISMELLSDEILQIIWNEMPGVTRVSFLGLVELFDLEMEFTLEPKTSVRKLDLISRKVLISQLGKFLRAAPYLDELQVGILNKHMMKTIAKEGISLKILFYEHIEEDVMEVYRELKITEENINKNIKLYQKSFWFHKDENPFSLDPVFWRK